MLHVVQLLRETVGGSTPMLKHEIEEMPRQQSKTLDALVRLNGAAQPAQEARLVAVEGEGKGRAATCRLTDRMFSI